MGNSKQNNTNFNTRHGDDKQGHFESKIQTRPKKKNGKYKPIMGNALIAIQKFCKILYKNLI